MPLRPSNYRIFPDLAEVERWQSSPRWLLQPELLRFLGQIRRQISRQIRRRSLLLLKRAGSRARWPARLLSNRRLLSRCRCYRPRFTSPHHNQAAQNHDTQNHHYNRYNPPRETAITSSSWRHFSRSRNRSGLTLILATNGQTASLAGNRLQISRNQLGVLDIDGGRAIL